VIGVLPFTDLDFDRGLDGLAQNYIFPTFGKVAMRKVLLMYANSAEKMNRAVKLFLNSQMT
jgi:hypothetical protein